MAITSLYCPSCGAHNTLDANTCFACQHPLDEPVRELLLHNRYRLLDQLGSGGFGAVHRAEDTQESNRVVAIKQINLAGLTPQQVIEATDGFNREVSLLSTLTHPHLPHIYEHFTDPDHWYLVMDFLEGETLETYLEKMYTHRGRLIPLPLTEVLDIGLQLCQVLDYLHSREPAIIFRDVKPANVMRTPAGTLYLIDFGIARHYKPGKPKDTIPFGSPGYAAPEQYGKAQTSPRSDIYSLGALLHMLLSGNDPVDNPFHFDPLRLYGADGISDLTALIERMVTLDVEQRPQSVQDVKDALQKISDAQLHALILPVAATPPPTHPSLLQPASTGAHGLQQMMMQRRQLRKQRQQYWTYNRQKSRRGFVIGTVGVVTALALVGTGLNSMFQSGEDRTGTGACTCASSASSPPLFGQAYPLVQVFHQETQLQHLVWSMNGNSVAMAANMEWCVQSLETTGLPQEFTNKVEMTSYTLSPILALAWQPEIDANIAFSTDQTLNLLSGAWSGSLAVLQDTQVQLTAQREPNAQTDEKVIIQSIAWSPDGKYVAFPFARGIQIWNAKTQTHVKNLLFSPALETVYEASQLTSLAWSPDGKYLAAAYASNQSIIWQLSDSTFYQNISVASATLVAWSPNSQFLATTNDNVINVTALSYMLSGTVDDSSLYRTFYTGHTGTVESLSWSPDGRFIASCSSDTGDNLHVWTPFDVSQAPPAKNQTTLGNPSPGGDYVFWTNMGNAGVYSVAWSPDGKNLLVGTNNAYLIPLVMKFLS